MTIAKVLAITVVRIDVQDAMDAREDVTEPVKVHVTTLAKDIVTQPAKVVVERFLLHNGLFSLDYQTFVL